MLTLSDEFVRHTVQLRNPGPIHHSPSPSLFTFSREKKVTSFPIESFLRPHKLKTKQTHNKWLPSPDMAFLKVVTCVSTAFIISSLFSDFCTQTVTKRGKNHFNWGLYSTETFLHSSPSLWVGGIAIDIIITLDYLLSSGWIISGNWRLSPGWWFTRWLYSFPPFPPNRATCRSYSV